MQNIQKNSNTRRTSHVENLTSHPLFHFEYSQIATLHITTTPFRIVPTTDIYVSSDSINKKKKTQRTNK